MFVENITDQLLGFTEEVEHAVSSIVKKGYTKAQAIEIVRIGVEDIKAEEQHQFNHIMRAKNELFQDYSEILSEINQSIVNLDSTAEIGQIAYDIGHIKESICK